MQPLNAIDALAPAFTRTHQTLFHPFRWGRSWKLAASSYLGWAGSLFIPWPLALLLFPRLPGAEALRPFLLIVGAFSTILPLIILYFCGRMELVVFEMVVTRAKFVAPMWRRYSARVWPWLGYKILIGTVFTLAAAALFYTPIRHLAETIFASMGAFGTTFPKGDKPDPAAIQAMIAPIMSQWINLELISLILAFLLKIPSTLLNDFVLPFYVLEDIPFPTAVSRGFKVFLADPVQVILYLILKPILFVIGYVMQSIALQVVMIPFIILGVIGAVIGGVSVHRAGAGVGVLFIVAAVLFGILFTAFIFYATLGATGYLITLLEAYGIYFLGGRYPLLGNLLEPGPGAPFTPPPVFPSDEERQDEDDGPPMPMDPAVA